MLPLNVNPQRNPDYSRGTYGIKKITAQISTLKVLGGRVISKK